MVMARKTLPETGGIKLDFTDSGQSATKLKVFVQMSGRKDELREIFEWNEEFWIDSIPAGAVTLTINEATSAANVGSASASATVSAGLWTSVAVSGASGSPTDPTSSTRLHIGNCYVRPGEAEVYFNTRPETTAWDNASVANQEKALIAATKMIDGAYRFKGARLDGTRQVLQFPRLLERSALGSSNLRFIPFDVKEAVCEQAFHILDQGLLSKRKQLQSEGVTSFSVGHLSESYGSSGKAGLCHQAESMLKPWIARGGKLRGAGFDEFDPTPGSGGRQGYT